MIFLKGLKENRSQIIVVLIGLSVLLLNHLWIHFDTKILILWLFGCISLYLASSLDEARQQLYDCLDYKNQLWKEESYNRFRKGW